MKLFLQPKVLRLLALGLILLASLLLLVQSQFGTTYAVVMGTITRAEEGKAIVNVIAAEPRTGQAELAVSASKLLLGSIEKAGEAEFLAVVNQRGSSLVFERIFLLSAPTGPGLQGPRSGTGELGLAVGAKPELVEMIGLDKYGYELSPPAWAKERLPGADKVYYQRGSMDAAKAVLDGLDPVVSPDVYVLDSQGRIAGMRNLGRRLLPLPEVMRRTALSLYGAALLAGLGSLLAYKWPQLAKAGRRIWDQVSMRGRKASS